MHKAIETVVDLAISFIALSKECNSAINSNYANIGQHQYFTTQCRNILSMRFNVSHCFLTTDFVVKFFEWSLYKKTQLGNEGL